MASKLVVVLSYKICSSDLVASTVHTQKDYDESLQLMTHIFRMNFWSVFTEVQTFNPIQKNCNIFGMKMTASDVFVCYSSKDRLDATEPADYLIAAVFTLQASSREFKTREQKISRIERRAIIERIIDQLLGIEFIKKFSSDVPGYSSHILRDNAGIDDKTTALITAYFCYGWLVLLRLSRDQMTIRTYIDQVSMPTSSSDILRQRSRLINIARHFLSHDRSNNPNLQKICDGLRSKYDMDARFENLNTIHSLIERHLDNVTNIVQMQRSRSVSTALNILTFSTIPLAIAGTALAINLEASLLTKPSDVLNSSGLQLILGLSLVVPLILLTVAKFADTAIGRIRRR
jgi:hypothetical protein